MNSHDLTRLLIEGVVSRALNQVQKDSHRTLRNLVDLGLTFSKGRFQQTFLEMAQRMLENENSAYYALLDLLIQRADLETLKTFGINVGYESLTRGARTIRRLEEAGGYNIPWALAMELEDMALARQVIRQGVELGICTYGFVGAQADLVALRELTEEQPRCAFLLLTSGENLLGQGLAPLEGARNLFISVQDDGPGLEAAEALSAGGFLYGVHVICDGPDCVAPERLEHYLDYRPAAVLLLPGNARLLTEDQGLYDRVKALRFQQKYPYFLMDLVRDGLYTDQVISGDPCLMHVRAGGEAILVDSHSVRPAGNLAQLPLDQVLRRSMPKHSAAKEGEV